MHAQELRPLVTEVPEVQFAAALADLEQVRSSRSDESSWMVEATLRRWGLPAGPSFGSQLISTFAPNQAAAKLGDPLCSFCASMLDAVQLQLHERLEQLRSALDAAPTCQLELQLSVTLMLSRKASDDEYRDEIIHADAFDGTVLCLALVCSKMGTRLYPDATFVQPPVEQFLAESATGKRTGFSRVVDGAHGEERVLTPDSLMIMPAAIAHARPNGRVDEHAPPGPRWFARAHLELRPTAGRAAWDSTQRMTVALLVAEHVWRDAGFVRAVRLRLEEATSACTPDCDRAATAGADLGILP